MVQRLPFYAIILVFTVFVAVASRPSYNSKSTQLKKESIIALRQFDPKKALHKRRTDQSLDSAEGVGKERGPWGNPKPPKPKPSHYHR